MALEVSCSTYNLLIMQLGREKVLKSPQKGVPSLFILCLFCLVPAVLILFTFTHNAYALLK